MNNGTHTPNNQLTISSTAAAAIYMGEAVEFYHIPSDKARGNGLHGPARGKFISENGAYGLGYLGGPIPLT